MPKLKLSSGTGLLNTLLSSPYSTTTKSCLNVHVRHGHQQLRDFACGFCGLQFPLRVNLMNHVAMAHAGNKVWMENYLLATLNFNW